MGNSIFKRRLSELTGTMFTALLVLGGLAGVSSCSDDLLVGTPSWLGSSIYEELESRGNFNTTLALINDPEMAEAGYAEVLRRTGSRTLFVADDDAWQRFFQRKGISGLSDLSLADKKMLLKSSMVNSAYLIELLSNKSGEEPERGACMRRESLQDPMDRIPVLTPEQFPVVNPARVDKNNRTLDFWSYLRSRDSVLILQDENSQNMIHFLPDYMTNKSITNSDYMVLTNNRASDVSRSYINGQVVTEADVTCQNGYIHILEEVPEPLDNMANEIAKKSDFTIFSRLLDRFSYPEYNAAATATYRQLTGKTDSVFVKRYFNEDNSNNKGTNSHKSFNNGTTTVQNNGQLLYDPGWNRYRIYTGDDHIDWNDDCAAMLVPSDSAMMKFFVDGPLYERYKDGGWDAVPDNVIEPLLNNHMLSSFSSTVPSKFAQMKNSAGDEMGIQLEDVDSCFVCNNGVIYKVNKVFTAPEYKSVFFPAIIRGTTDMSAIYTSVYASNSNWKLTDYQAYLNSTGSKYSYILPTDEAMKNYVDPVSLKRTDEKGGPVYYEFYIDQDATDVVSARAYKINDNPTDTTRTLAINDAQPTTDMIQNRLGDLLDNTIIVQSDAVPQFHSDQTIYTNKAGAPIIVQFTGDSISAIGGSAEYENNQLIPVERIYNQLENDGNGITYVVNKIPSATLTSPYAALSDSINHPDFSVFESLLRGCDFLKQTVGSSDNAQATLDRAISFLSAYHYTMFVPSNAKLQALIDAGQLPTWDEYDAWEEYRSTGDETYSVSQIDSIEAIIRSKIESFVRYHIQDNSVYFNGEQISNQPYETALLDTATNRFRRLNVTYDGNDITVTDLGGSLDAEGVAHSNTQKVVKGADSNVMTTQYLFAAQQGESSGKTNLENARFIYSVSYIVMHKIDEPLFYDKAKQILSEPLPVPPVVAEEGDEGGEGGEGSEVKRHKIHRR
ncbi:MAG: hypothetical protein K6A32_05460 [Bacteroidales bacterium]|nr:hypothetical protein [Bacteroidales bacterium]